MGVLPDFLIENEVKIDPFDPGGKRPGKISSGLGSYGYDARLGYRFRVMTPHRCTAAIIDPKQDDPSAWEEIDLSPRMVSDGKGGRENLRPDFLPIPPGGFVLGETLETFTVPRDVLCVVFGKSTYARVGIQVYVTPGEPEWTGKWTVEISNHAPLPVKVYPGEGIMQCIFLRTDAFTQAALAAILEDAGRTNFGLHAALSAAAGLTCRRSYADKAGKYQSQGGLTPAKVD